MSVPLTSQKMSNFVAVFVVMGRGGNATIQFDKLNLGSVIMPKVIVWHEASLDPAVTLLFLKYVSFFEQDLMMSTVASSLASCSPKA
jgi:hypothetical protein